MPTFTCCASSELLLLLLLPHTWHIRCGCVTQDAESKEVALEVKHAAKALEADEMACCLAELDSQLADKRAEGEEAAGRRAGVIGELEVLLAEQEAAAAFKNALTKAFDRWAIIGVGGQMQMISSQATVVTGTCRVERHVAS